MYALNASEEPMLHYRGAFGAQDLAVIRRDVGAAAREAGLGEEDTDQFVLAISEAVTNVIEHAYGDGQLSVYRTGDRLVADVTDHGPGFTLDPAGATPPPQQPRGRGLWLMRRCVDQLELFSRNVTHCLRLVKIIPSALVVTWMKLLALRGRI